MPGVVDGLLAAEAAIVAGDDAAILAHHDPIGVGVHLDRTTDCLSHHRVAVLVELHQAGLRHRRRLGMEAVERPGVAHQARALGLEHLPDRAVAPLRMRMALGVADALLQQPGIQLRETGKMQPRLEEPLAHHVDLVLNLTFLPPRCWRTGGRLDQIMAAHLQKTAVEHPLAADEHRVHRSAHIVVDAALAGAAEKPERLVMGVKHHLLRLARIRPHEQHPAMAQPYLRHLDLGRGTAQHHDLVAPVELIRLPRRKAQRNERVAGSSSLLALTRRRIPADSIVTALISSNP